jgi:hypothetical protein
MLNPALPLRLQSARPAGRVAELVGFVVGVVARTGGGNFKVEPLP